VRKLVDIDVRHGNFAHTYIPAPSEVRSQQVLLLYSGGLDTSTLVHWLTNIYECKVVTLTVDVGQREDFAALERKAYKLGAVDHILVDGRHRLITEYGWRAIRANARVGLQGHPLSSSLTRPLIAQIAAQIAAARKIAYVAHGASGKSNDNFRFDMTLLVRLPGVKILAPVRDWNMTRDEELAYAAENGIEVPVRSTMPVSIDDNLWACEVEAGPLNDLSLPIPDELWTILPHPLRAAKAPATVKLTFRGGEPVGINHSELSPVELMMRLNDMGRRHAIGVFDCLEDRAMGLKVRELHFAPGVTILLTAFSDLEMACLTSDSLQIKRKLDHYWAELMLTGRSTEPAIGAIDAAISALTKHLSGDLDVELFMGQCRIIRRDYPNSLDVRSQGRRGIETSGETAAACIERLAQPLRAMATWNAS
jgi:argininosuccinate synthase